MRSLILILLVILLGAIRQAGAGVIIDGSQAVGPVPSTGGTGLSGSYYDFSASSPITSLSQASQLITAAGAATATFTTNAVCFPDCAGTSTGDGNPLSTLLNGNVSNFSYTVPGTTVTSLDHGAMVLTGYIAVTHPGTYTYYLGSDDGSQLLIAGQSVVSYDPPRAFGISTGTATFAAAGLYAINILYYENTGVTALDLYVQDNSTGQCIIGRSANCAPGTATTSLFYNSIPAAAPEPTSLWILAAGLLALAAGLRLRRRTI